MKTFLIYLFIFVVGLVAILVALRFLAMVLSALAGGA